MTQVPRRITTRQELVDLANDLNIPGDWHELDQHGVTAAVHGLSLDTAGMWPLGEVTRLGDMDRDPIVGIPDIQPTPTYAEMYVTLRHNGRAVADVNLASLFAWATGMCGHVSPEACRADPVTGGK